MVAQSKKNDAAAAAAQAAQLPDSPEFETTSPLIISTFIPRIYLTEMNMAKGKGKAAAIDPIGHSVAPDTVQPFFDQVHTTATTASTVEPVCG